jgi:hypothetical protein
LGKPAIVITVLPGILKIRTDGGIPVKGTAGRKVIILTLQTWRENG